MATGQDTDALGAIPEVSFSKAKAGLSALVDEVVNHRPASVSRHRGRQRLMLVSHDDLAAALESFVFQPQVTVLDGEFTIRLPELNLISGGSSYEEAVEELAELAEDYAAIFFDDLDYHLKTDQRAQLPWLLRLGLTPRPEWPEVLSPSTPPPRAVTATELV